MDVGAISRGLARSGMFGGAGGVGGPFPGARPLDGGLPVPALGGPDQAGGPSFGDTLKGFVNEVSAQQDAAGELRDKFLRGEHVEVHQVMAAGEEAGIALELMVELRNKVAEAYRTLVSMQS